MVRWMCGIAAACAGLMIGCDGGGAGATPQETFESLKAAAAVPDFGAIWDMLSKKKHQEFAKEAKIEQMREELKKIPEAKREEASKEAEKQFGMTLDELLAADERAIFVAGCKKKVDKADLDKITKSEYVKTDIDGDTAKVTFKTGERQRPMRFVKEDGVWKLDELPD